MKRGQNVKKGIKGQKNTTHYKRDGRTNVAGMNTINCLAVKR